MQTLHFEYFQKIQDHVNQPTYNQIEEQFNNFDKLIISNFQDKASNASIKHQMAVHGHCLIEFENHLWTDLEKIQAWLSAQFGELITNRNRSQLPYAEIKAENSGKLYINSHLTQPMHTDEGHTNNHPNIVALYCSQPATIGGISILVAFQPLYKKLQEIFGPAVKELFHPDALKVENYQSIEAKPLLLKNSDNKIGISYSPILKLLWAKPIVIQMYDYVTQYVHQLENQIRFKLKRGQLLILDNCQVLHARTGFPPSSQRLLYRYWF